MFVGIGSSDYEALSERHHVQVGGRACTSNTSSWCELAQVPDSHHSLPLTPHALHACLQVGPFSFTAASAAVVPGRVAYLLGYSGASAAVDTACSASLVACHMAVSELRAGRSQRAVAAGVMLQLVPQSALMVVSTGCCLACGVARGCLA